MDAFKWAEDAARRLKREFGDRLSFVGLQGSRARGEARENSDIDLVVLLDGISADDLRRCRTVIQTMPQKELACGFVGSTRAVASWPRHELLQFVCDTRPICGDFESIIDTGFTSDDALRAARIGASGIYHALCHARVFDGIDAEATLEPLFKQALILEVGRDWEAHRPADAEEAEKLTDLLLRWSENVMASTNTENPER